MRRALTDYVHEELLCRAALEAMRVLPLEKKSSGVVDSKFNVRQQQQEPSRQNVLAAAMEKRAAALHAVYAVLTHAGLADNHEESMAIATIDFETLRTFHRLIAAVLTEEVSGVSVRASHNPLIPVARAVEVRMQALAAQIDGAEGIEVAAKKP
jgi:hypothetical protein